MKRIRTPARLTRAHTLIAPLAVCVLAAGGCDQLKERAGIPDPAKIEAEGKAIGSACRQAGWGLEDCYRLNPDASKPAMFGGWKDMNEYMAKNNMQAMPPTVPAPSEEAPEAKEPKKKKPKVIELEPIGGKDAENKGDADKRGNAQKSAQAADDSDNADKDTGH